MIIKTIIAVDSLPVRKNGKLLPNQSCLFPDYRTGVFAEVQPDRHIFNIIIDISEMAIVNIHTYNYTLNGKLEGSDEKIFSSSEFTFLNQKELLFSVRIRKNPQGFMLINQETYWQMVVPETNMKSKVEKVKLMFCFLPKLPFDANKGLAIESLHFTNQAFPEATENKCLVDGNIIKRTGYKDQLSDVAAIINWMFSRQKKAVYDSSQGSCHFISGPDFNNITLYYKQIYSATTSQICNCYDMAAFLQYQVQYSAGIFVYFDFIEPFGYLTKSELIGRGLCNNPFFLQPAYNSNQVCDERDKKRSAFGNHAFIYMPYLGVVADACAGPHIGTETKQQYLKAAIDPITPIPSPISPGTLYDIKDFKGVTKVTTSLKADSIMNHKNLLGFIKSVNIDHSGLKKEIFFFRKKLDLLECPIIKENFKILKDEIHSDFPFAIRHILLIGNSDKSIEFKVWVSSTSNEGALKQYLALGSNHQMLFPIFEKGPDFLGESSGKFEATDYSRYIWLFQNMVFDLKARNLPPKEVMKIVSWNGRNIGQHAKQIEQTSIPQIYDIKISNDHVKVGETVNVELGCPEELKLFIDGDHPGLYINAEGDNSFTFIAKSKSLNSFLISAVNPTTLLSTKKDITIIVE